MGGWGEARGPSASAQPGSRLIAGLVRASTSAGPGGLIGAAIGRSASTTAGRAEAGTSATSDPDQQSSSTGKPVCRCEWAGQRCTNPATQEDGLCDWCGVRRPDQLRGNPNAMFDPDGRYLGLGGRGETHVNPERRPDACWMPNSGRTLLRP